MRRPVFDPSKLAPVISPEGARLITVILRRSTLHDTLVATERLTDEQRYAALDAWNALYTIARLPTALDAAERARESIPVVDDGEDEPMTTREAADVLGVTQGRVRQLVLDGKLGRFEGSTNRRTLLDPQEVQQLALLRHRKAA